MIRDNAVNIAIGGQFGSEGKGKVYGHLYDRYPIISSCVCDFTPNSGHTCYVDWRSNKTNLIEPRKVVSKILPMGAFYKHVKHVIIGPHAVFSKDRLWEEIQVAREIRHDPDFKPHIHPMATILQPEDTEAESRFNHIASTMQGTCEASIRKMRRDPDDVSLVKNDRDIESIANVCDTHKLLFDLMRSKSGACLIETAQGFDLGLNNGLQWPFVTSRDCLLGRALDNAGVSPRFISNIIGVCRTFPIRVGNTPGGFSGPVYHDQSELTWPEVSGIAGKAVREFTTVTKRERRVFSFSRLQMQRFLECVRPHFLCVNFLDYLPENQREKWIHELQKIIQPFDCELKYVGTGPGIFDYEVR